jgi:predicted kinase
MWCLEAPSEDVRQAQLLLIRGLPGAGKSTMAKSLLERGYFDMHLEADMFHMERGRYVYRTTSALAAHSWCANTTRVMLNNGKRVVVTNTFVLLEELRPYMELGFPFHIVEAKGPFESIHSVPPDVIDHMRKRWQELP